MLPTGTLSHQISGRARVRVSALRGDLGFFAHVQERLSACEGVSSVLTNAQTASVLIHHTGAPETIWDFAQSAGLFQIRRDTGLAMASGQAEWTTDLLRLLGHGESGTVSLQGLLFFALVVLAIWQAAEGNVMAPAVTLLWYALHVMQGNLRVP